MLVNLFLSLFFLGGVSFFLPKDKYSRFFSVLFWMAAAYLGWLMIGVWMSAQAEPFVFHWIQYQKLHIDINLSSNQYNFSRLAPFGLIAVLSLLANIFSRQEDRRVRLGGLMCVNLAILIILLCADNLIILLISAFLIGVTTLYMINDYDSKKTYIFYNLIADMALFTAFAIIYSRFHQVELSVLARYAAVGEHKVLVSLLILLCLMIKNGLFLFQNQLLCLRELNYNRLIFISFSSLPVVGIMIYEKALPLFSGFEYARSLITVFAGLSAVYAFCGALVYDDIKEKTLCFNMLFWAMVYGLSLMLPHFSFALFVPLFLMMWGLNSLLHSLSASASDELYVSKMGGFIRALWPQFILFLIWYGAFSCTLLSFWGSNSMVNIGLSITLLALSIALAHLLRQIFFGQTQSDDLVTALLRNMPHVVYWLPPLFISLWFFRENMHLSPQLLTAWGIFAFLLIAYPLRRLSLCYANEEFQLSEFFRRFYELVIITPITVLGRILWLTIDFVIIERTIINSLSNMIKFLIKVSQKIHRPSLINYVILTLCGLGIMFIYAGR